MKFKSLLLLLCLVVSSCNSVQPSGTADKKEDLTVPPTNVDPKYPFRIVRVEPNPTSTGTGFQTYRNEGIWIRNFSSATVSSVGWSVLVKSNKLKYSLRPKTNESENINPSRVGIFAENTFTVSNSLPDEGDTLQLIASDGTIVQTIGYGKTVGQMALVFYEQPKQLRIRLIIPNPVGSDDGKEYVEIENLSQDTVTIGGWTLRSKGGQVKSVTTSPNFRIFPYLSFNAGVSGIVAWLNNEGDTLDLVAPDGTVVHHVEWQKVNDGEYIYP